KNSVSLCSFYFTAAEITLPGSISGCGNIVCPDQKSVCPDQTTCCQMTNGTYGCCPMPSVSQANREIEGSILY
uniref:Granulins domain-containing protein n=1 Tax=Amphiprion ocellaris TaxID=80972 RepID=A0AAQ5Y2L5_AMPOC